MLACETVDLVASYWESCIALECETVDLVASYWESCIAC